MYLRFSVANHPDIRRLGNNLYTTVDLNLYTAVLGGEITLNTLDGKVKLRVNPETQNGSKVKLKGQGFPVYKNEGQKGDLIVTWAIRIPTNLSEKQKALFTELSTS
ncbi:MAG: DnaJ-class molecular chaperone with C-terminal Zn finger domain [Bacteroidetes bacterium]|nr:MAG: DnaJ-class molecular chaperone with C-terminal Zn finger domain [Bacteroidota bacterium]